MIKQYQIDQHFHLLGFKTFFFQKNIKQTSPSVGVVPNRRLRRSCLPGRQRRRSLAGDLAPAQRQTTGLLFRTKARQIMFFFARKNETNTQSGHVLSHLLGGVSSVEIWRFNLMGFFDPLTFMSRSQVVELDGFFNGQTLGAKRMRCLKVPRKWAQKFQSGT